MFTVAPVAAFRGVKQLVRSFDVCQLRAVNRAALGIIGELRLQHFEATEPLVVAPPLSTEDEELLVATPASSSSAVPFSTADSILTALETPGGYSAVTLGPAMRRCLALLRRLRHALLDDVASDCVEAATQQSGIAKLVEVLKRLCDAVEAGRVSSPVRFAQIARAAFGDALLAAWEDADLEGGRLQQAAFAEVLHRFETDLLLVEVPEIDCTHFKIPDVCSPVLALDLELRLRCWSTTAPQVPKFRPRWLWAEIALVDEDGMELDHAPRARVDGVQCDSFDSAQKGGVTFSVKLRGSQARQPVSQLLRALPVPNAHSLKISVRVDWPILQNFQLQIGTCRVVIADLKPVL